MRKTKKYPFAVASDGSASTKITGVEARWPGRLSKAFSTVSSYFLANYHRLRPHPGARGLTSSEAMVVIQILDFKWSEAAPFPTLKTIATRMGISQRQVRSIVKQLEELEYLERVQVSDWSSNRFYFEGLYAALEKLMDEDNAKEAEEADKEGA